METYGFVLDYVESICLNYIQSCSYWLIYYICNKYYHRTEMQLVARPFRKKNNGNMHIKDEYLEHQML